MRTERGLDSPVSQARRHGALVLVDDDHHRQLVQVAGGRVALEAHVGAVRVVQRRRPGEVGVYRGAVMAGGGLQIRPGGTFRTPVYRKHCLLHWLHHIAAARQPRPRLPYAHVACRMLTPVAPPGLCSVGGRLSRPNLEGDSGDVCRAATSSCGGGAREHRPVGGGTTVTAGAQQVPTSPVRHGNGLVPEGAATRPRGCAWMPGCLPFRTHQQLPLRMALYAAPQCATSATPANRCTSPPACSCCCCRAAALAAAGSEGSWAPWAAAAVSFPRPNKPKSRPGDRVRPGCCCPCWSGSVLGAAFCPGEPCSADGGKRSAEAWLSQSPARHPIVTSVRRQKPCFTCIRRCGSGSTVLSPEERLVSPF